MLQTYYHPQPNKFCNISNLYSSVYSNELVFHLVASNKIFISFGSLNSHDCNSCKCNKNHKLPFYDSTLASRAPLDYICFPMFGLSLFLIMMVFSILLFLLITLLAIYIWFYPLKRKYDVHNTFSHFKKIVEKEFICLIIQL